MSGGAVRSGLILAVSGGLLWFCWGLYLGSEAVIPSFEQVKSLHRSSDILLMDREDRPLHQLRLDLGARRLPWTPLTEVSPALQEVIIASEDRRFWKHGGVDWPALLRAGWFRLQGKKAGGASTLTMQLAARLDPGLRPSEKQRSPGQKWAQLRAAWALERNWSKARILEAYLNLVSFRGEVQGIHAASRALLDKFPSGVEREEALLLAALIPSPNASGERVAQRACTLASRLGAQADVCPRLEQMALRVLTGGLPPIRPLQALAPHAALQLAARLPGGQPLPERLPSTLDGPLQRFAVETMALQLAQLAGRNVHDGALLAVDNDTGEILAYVGNAGNHQATRQVDGVTAPRQPGSALKPILYQLALEQRLLTAASLLEDAPVELDTNGGLYAPQNYDMAFKGWVSLRTALASSLNVPAVRTLMLVGPVTFLERLRRLGFDLLDREAAYYGYALALGSGEVTLRQLVGAYRTLANGGLASPLTLQPGRERIEPERVMDPASAFIVAQVLADPIARGMTFGLDNPLSTPFWSAVKTGTSKQMRDNWCVGFSSRYTVGVWVGNFDGSPMHEVSGVSGAAPAWLEVMNFLHRGQPSLPPPPPPGLLATRVSFEPPLEPSREEWFLKDTELTTVRLNAQRPVRIQHPPEGAILAIDPDIPPERQRLFFLMSPPDANLSWRLDGHKVIDPQQGWFPTPGSHHLELVRQSPEKAETLDRVRFEVRGALAKPWVDSTTQHH
ncbi:MAG: penicillin-binding protein 1C [Magnetococcales bacterium]|nr:penicillin-binding protein 1C [Magnetococcales bacterium]